MLECRHQLAGEQHGVVLRGPFGAGQAFERGVVRARQVQPSELDHDQRMMPAHGEQGLERIARAVESPRLAKHLRVAQPLGERGGKRGERMLAQRPGIRAHAQEERLGQRRAVAGRRLPRSRPGAAQAHERGEEREGRARLETGRRRAAAPGAAPHRGLPFSARR